MSLILILILILIIFSYIGIIHQLNISQHVIEFNKLKKFETHIVDIINNKEFEKLSDSLLVRKIQSVVTNQISQASFLAPIDGFVTQSINFSTNHNGIDIASEKGQDILSSGDGVVVFSGMNGDLGNTIIISHPYNYFTVYSHCDSLLIKDKSKVSKGQVIATVGESGKASAPHLHFEIWYNDSIIDPRNIINKYGVLDVSTE